MQAQSVFGLNITLNKATLGGFSGAAATFTAANPVVAAIGGKVVSTNLSVASAVTTDAVTGVAFLPIPAGTAASGANPGKAYGSVYVVTVNGAGTKGVVQGSIEKLDPANASFVVAPQLPSLPETLTAIGYVVVKGATTSAAFTFGTSNWNATGITIAGPVDVCVLPAAPQIA